MITDLKGTRSLIRGAFYTIGDKIIVEDGPYNGMYGVIAEIRTETDSALGADTPEIYCELYPPFGSEGLSAVKKRRSKKSQAQTIMENISTVRVGLHFGEALFFYKCMLLFGKRQLTNMRFCDKMTILQYQSFARAEHSIRVS